MNQIINVASYIMGRIDGLNDRDLQRLCFYSQAAFLVQTGKPLFEEDFLAWKTGPVCLELKSFLSSKKKPSDKTLFSPEEQSCMEDVIARYGKLSSFSLDQRCLSDMLDIFQDWNIVNRKKPFVISKEFILKRYKELDERSFPSSMGKDLIARLEAQGFQRWTRYGHDRLYLMPRKLPIKFEINDSATLYHQRISSEIVSRILAANYCYIDVNTGRIASDCPELIWFARRILKACMKDSTPAPPSIEEVLQKAALHDVRSWSRQVHTLLQAGHLETLQTATAFQLFTNHLQYYFQNTLAQDLKAVVDLRKYHQKQHPVGWAADTCISYLSRGVFPKLQDRNSFLILKRAYQTLCDSYKQQTIR